MLVKQPGSYLLDNSRTTTPKNSQFSLFSEIMLKDCGFQTHPINARPQQIHSTIKALITERKGTSIPTAAICLLQYRLWYSDGESVSNHLPTVDLAR